MYKVLIADDERMVRLTLRTLIEREAAGFTVLAEAKDGDQAYRISLESRPDVIITDIRMPGLTGLELIRNLSAHKFEPEYLVVSGHDDFGYAQAAIRSGVADYLLKPIDPAYFSNALGRIAARLNSKSGRRESRDWMWTWKGYAEQAAEAIWGLNEAGLAAETARIGSYLEAEGNRPDTVPDERLDYYRIVLNGTLQELNRSGLPLPEWRLPEQPAGTAELKEAVQAGLAGLLEHVRMSRNWSYNRVIQTVKAFLEEHYRNPGLSLKDAAAHLDLSPNYFGAVFKRELGQSFTQYLTALRMEKAKEVLLDPNRKVYEAGDAVGYEDYAYFSKTFKKYTGLSPSDYRKSGMPEERGG